MKNVALRNLGCKVNSYEIEVMQQMLQEKGYNVVSFDEVADIYIVNTCTVTNIADRKSRQMLHRAKQKNPNALVVAVGCYVQTGKEQVELDESIDLAIGNNRKKDLASIIEEYLETHGMVDKTLSGATIPDISSIHEYEEMTLKQTAEHTRAYIKIQDGCNQFCSYCVIPYARGRVRSRPQEKIMAEIKGLAAGGYREVVLTGIHISSYGIDFPDGSGGLIDLVEAIHGIDGIDRIRLGSLEPRIVTQGNARRLAALPKLCPHFHLSLQSGCDETLKRMNRHYTTGEYYQSVEYLRQAFTNPGITTDVIVGFPGETEEEFLQTKAFLEKVGFYEMHIFKYSKREGTRAAVMPNQVPGKVQTERSNTLLALERVMSKDFRSHYIGKVAQVLFEEVKEIDGECYLLGHTGDYVKVAVKDPGKSMAEGINTMREVSVTGFLQDEILLAR